MTCVACLRVLMPKSPEREPIIGKAHITKSEWAAWHTALLNYTAIHGTKETARRLRVATASVTYWCHGNGKPSRGALERIVDLLIGDTSISPTTTSQNG